MARSRDDAIKVVGWCACVCVTTGETELNWKLQQSMEHCGRVNDNMKSIILPL